MRLTVPKLLAVLLATLLAAPAEASAASGELRAVVGSSWQARSSFAIEWEPIAPPDPTEAEFRVYDSGGQLRHAFDQPLALMLNGVEVPPVPDVYTLEAWLQNDAGQSGPHSTTTLHFDNVAPAAPVLVPPSGWLLGTDPAVLQVDPSTQPPPLSGVAGYAVSVDGGSPCAQPDRCLAGEIDLAGGGGGGISLGTLPQGAHLVRAVTVSGSGVPSTAVVATLRVDATAPLVSLDGVPAGWSGGPVQVTARADDVDSGMAAAGALGPFTSITVDGAAPSRALGATARAWIGGSGAHSVEGFARDAAGNLSRVALATARIDEDPPKVAFAAAQDPAEPERIEATVSDPLSGPSLDRGWIGIRPAGTRARFEPLPTRHAGDRLVARWASDFYPPGKYEFVATAFDGAGNQATGSDRTRGDRMFLVNPLKAQVELATRLARRRLSGRLRRFGGGPLAGREVLVTETFAPGSVPRSRTTTVATDGRGEFSLRLRPGPSRDVSAGFAGTALLGRATSRAAHLEFATAVHLTASAATARVGGRPVVFAGEISRRGAAGVAGLPVELQFRFRGGAWSEFRTVEADRRGRFRYRYRFSDDDSRGIRFQFRAYVKGREGWPYGPGTSRPVQVTGR